MLPQTENFENISVKIYETGSFTKFDESIVIRSPFLTTMMKGTQTQTFLVI